jgi:hypothetical protein
VPGFLSVTTIVFISGAAIAAARYMKDGQDVYGD